MLGRFLHGVPGKTLLLGGDYLLSSHIRGGWCVPRDTGSEGMKEGPVASIATTLTDIWPDNEVAIVQAVVKADHQKEDDAAVPVHLWNSMFVKARAAAGNVQPLAAQ